MSQILNNIKNLVVANRIISVTEHFWYYHKRFKLKIEVPQDSVTWWGPWGERPAGRRWPVWTQPARSSKCGFNFGNQDFNNCSRTYINAHKGNFTNCKTCMNFQILYTSHQVKQIARKMLRNRIAARSQHLEALQPGQPSPTGSSEPSTCLCHCFTQSVCH